MARCQATSTTTGRMGHTLPESNYLDQIAALIKQDPSITVRQIASELKFADSKSVYYWLDKGNVGGINEFKRQILGHTPPKSGPMSFDIEGTPHYIVALSFCDWNPRQKNPGKEWYYIHTHPKPRGLFAIRVDTNRYSPWFVQNDVLIISTDHLYPEGSWALLKNEDEFLIGKVINKQVVDPVTLMAHSADLIRVGLVLSQERHFSS